MFLGDAFCHWLEEHQGCLANVDALLVPSSPSQLDVSLVEAVGGIDGLVVECGSLTVSTSAVLGALDCECPRHISDLVLALGAFEEYSASCSVENWQDASVHACIYAYAMQARWLMEKSLMLVLETHKDEPVD